MSLVRLEYVDVLETKNEKKSLEFSINLLKEPVNTNSLFALRVDGESMQPVIMDRTLLVADLSQKLVEDGKIYLVHYENALWVKQAKEKLGEMSFVSINEEYSHLVYQESEVHVVAKVVLSFHTF